MTLSPLEGAVPKTTTFDRRAGIAIHLYQDRIATWLTRFFGLMMLVGIVALVIGTFARSEAVRGYVSATSGLSRIETQFPGTVRDILVKQGDIVVQGQTIMRLSRRVISTGGVSTVGANRQSLMTRRANLTRDRDRLTAFLKTAKSDRDELQANRTNVEKAMEAQEASLKLSLKHQNDMVDRVRKYLVQGYATRDAFNSQERAAFDYTRQILDLKAKGAEFKQQVAEQLLTQRSAVEQKEASLSTVLSDLSAVQSQLAEADAQAAIDVTAPVGGRVVGLFVSPGETVTSEQDLATIGDPKAAPMIVLDVPARAIGLAKVGQEIVIKYDAFPYKTFGISHGVIIALSETPTRGTTPSEPGGTQDGQGAPVTRGSQQSTYRVEVRPESAFIKAYGRNEPIRLGSTLTADIVLEHRSLLDWVLDPIKAMRGRA